MQTGEQVGALGADWDWQEVLAILPARWQRQAHRLGAIRRRRRVRDPEQLLRMLLLHVADGYSLQEAACRIRDAGWGRISAVALHKRLASSEAWLGWMAQQLFQRRFPPRRPVPSRVLAVDASTVCEPGPGGSIYRVHWCVDLSSLCCREMQLTDVLGGEKLGRFALQRGDLVLGDRAYGTPPGIAYARERGAHVLVRINPAGLPLYASRGGVRFRLLPRLRKLRRGMVGSWPTWVQGPEGNWYRGRLIAIKRSRAAKQRELRHRQRSANSRDRQLSPQARELAGYLLLWTSVPAKTLNRRQVLRLYRLRWQIELVFKRMKSILGLGQLPKHGDATARAWLNGKLLVALLVEQLWQEAEAFSPAGWLAGFAAQPLA
jgi:hypothetical protein